ncbi:fimbrial protein [Salmonella enterica]|nr:fimbrial protein [Salmonella enterica]EBU1141585.1 fimbrial protein [Salmonella enterica]
MNKMVCGKTEKKNNRPASVLSHRLTQMSLWLVILCAIVLPGYAHADWDSDQFACVTQNGEASITLGLPPSVSFPPDNAPDKGQIIYRSQEYKINYKCKASNLGASMQLQKLSNFNPLNDALQKSGLELTIIIKNSDGTHIDDYNIATAGEQVAISRYYSGTITGTLSFQLVLKVKDTPKAGFVAIPSLTAFKVLAAFGGGTYPGIFINTPATRIQYVPTCFVRTSLGTNNVNFGPVLTTDVNNSLSRNIPFNVTADVNTSCNNGAFGNLQGTYQSGKKNYYLELPLKVSFILNNGGDVAPDSKSILLYTDKDDKQLKNGLRLKINAQDGEPVTFNEASLPVNKFGDFHGGEGGGTWRVSNTYNAVLSSTGDPVITGKYSAQVTVKVDYY